MKKILRLSGKTPRLTATWMPTGDARRPLACVWVIAEEKVPKISGCPEPDAGKWHECA
jgi:hypothetical protein